MVLSGRNAEMRDFIYPARDRARVRRDRHIQLAEGRRTGSLVVTLDLSTYFRLCRRDTDANEPCPSAALSPS